MDGIGQGHSTPGPPGRLQGELTCPWAVSTWGGRASGGVSLSKEATREAARISVDALVPGVVVAVSWVRGSPAAERKRVFCARAASDSS